MIAAEAHSRADYDYRHLGRLARARITVEGLGYRRAAAKIGVTAADLSRLDSGQPLAAHKVIAICDWLGLSFRALYSAPHFSESVINSTCCSGVHVEHAGCETEVSA